MALALTVGSVTLQDIEIPERAFGPLGGTQLVAVHRFPGGAKAVQALGAFPGPVEWSGILSGPTAFARVRALDRMRVLGGVQTVRYGPWVWLGVVREFTASPEHQWWIPYKIALEPIVDLSGQSQIAAPAQTRDDAFASVAADLATRAQDPSSPLVPSDSAPLALAASAAQTAQQTVAGAGGALADLTTAQTGLIQAAIQAAQEALAPIAASGPSDAASEAQALLDRLATLALVLGGVGLGTPILAQVQVVNPNLFQLAAAWYGDASQWGRIAQANRLVDPMPQGVFPALVIPP